MNFHTVGQLTAGADLIDAMGRLKAEKANLERREKALRDQIVALGLGPHEGADYRATVSVSERETIDMDAVRAHVSRQWLQAHTTVSTVTTVRVVARTGKL